MKWAAPRHLEVTYQGHADVTLQVVKFGDVAISALDLSGKPAGASK